ncbi:MAG: anaerobic ribonucleoside-triphosphate reductase activating protein [Eubacterium sp.]
MNYADIKRYDVANGPGIRVSIFVSGCRHHCKGCFNEVAWDFNYGTPFTQDTIELIIDYLNSPHFAGITFLGGEPMEPENQQGLLPLAKRVKEVYPDKTIWCFTGYDFEKDIMGYMYNKYPETKQLLSYIDVIVDGKFIEELKNVNLRFKGSSNQRTIMVQESINSKNIVLWQPPENKF